MKVLWVILNEEKNAVLESFESRDSDSRPYWDKFMEYKAGSAYCRIDRENMFGTFEKKWYYSYFFWEDTTRWGYGGPSGVGFAACLAVPQILKMVEFVE